MQLNFKSKLEITWKYFLNGFATKTFLEKKRSVELYPLEIAFTIRIKRDDKKSNWNLLRGDLFICRYDRS